MPAINFPDTPTIGDSYSAAGRVWNWDGVAWRAQGTAFGPTGPAGVGIAEGGTTGQVLAKASGDDYDTEWVDSPPPALENLTDVAIVTAQDGEILQYNGTTGLWENGPAPITNTIDGGDPQSTYTGDVLDGGDASSF